MRPSALRKGREQPPTRARAGPARAGASWRRLPGSSRDGDGTGAVELSRLGDPLDRRGRLGAGPDDRVGEADGFELVEQVAKARGIRVRGPTVLARTLAGLVQPDAHGPAHGSGITTHGVEGVVQVAEPSLEHLVDAP